MTPVSIAVIERFIRTLKEEVSPRKHPFATSGRLTPRCGRPLTSSDGIGLGPAPGRSPARCGRTGINGRQGRAGLEERADETQKVTEKLPDACQQVPEVQEEVDDGIHADLVWSQNSIGGLRPHLWNSFLARRTVCNDG